MSEVKRPVLRYHGGKWRISNWIIRFFPKHHVYVEPFGGAASVLLRKDRAYAEIYNDLDENVVNLFSVLRDAAMSKELIRLVSLTPFSRSEFDLGYEPHDCPIEKARRYLVVSHMGWGSKGATGKKTGFRGTSNRKGSIPAHDWANMGGVLETVVDRLSGVMIENCDAIKCMDRHSTPQTLNYVDPPYMHEHRSGHLYTHEMTDADHSDLIEYLLKSDAMHILSGYQTDLYVDKLESNGWARHVKQASDSNNNKRIECVWISPNAQIQIPLL